MGNPRYFRQSLGSERIPVNTRIANQIFKKANASEKESYWTIAPHPKYRGVLEFLTPDRMTISLEQIDGSGRKKISIATNLTRYESWQNCWSQDGNLLYMACFSQGLLYKIDPRTGRVEKLALNPIKNPESEEECHLFGVTKQGKFLLANSQFVYFGPFSKMPAKSKKALQFVEIGFDNESNYTRKFEVPMPFSEHINSQDPYGIAIALPSNHLDKLLIAGAFQQVNLIFSWLHTKVLAFPDGNRNVQEAWLGNIDGSDMQMIGYIPVKGFNEEEPWAIDPEWSPDDSQISFLYNDGIYFVPAK